MAQSMPSASREGDREVSTPILSQLQSPLLRLPSEIRNKIYEHVLGESIPLHVVGFHYSHWGAPYKTHARRLHQINELERTCRKLRAETGNMGSTWNHISLYSGYVDSAIIPNSGPRRVMHYSVEQGQSHNFLRSILHTRYALLCKADPLLEVAIFTRALRNDIGCWGLLILGAALQLVVRGNKLPFQVDAGLAREVENMVLELQKFEGRFFQLEVLPNNIRIYRWRSTMKLR